MFQGSAFRDVAGPTADHDAQLRLVVILLCRIRERDVLAAGCNAVVKLRKDNGSIGWCASGFLYMPFVVQTNADQLASNHQAGAEAQILDFERQPCRRAKGCPTLRLGLK